jgi:sec-independent protein translocase protein TatA
MQYILVFEKHPQTSYIGETLKLGVIAMGSLSIWHWLIVLAIALLLFGRGKIPELMGDVAKGIKSFKKGMNDDEETPPSQTTTSRTVEHKADESK